MKPMNQSERNKTFIPFLLLFLITIGLIVTVVFLSLEVPLREGDQMRKEMFDLRTKKAVLDSFNLELKEAMDEMDKFDQKATTSSAMRQQVQFRVNDMEKLLKSVPDGGQSVYALIIRNIRDLSEAKAKLSSLEQQYGQP